ncbi:MAG: amidohydrolase [Clostridia bacterium]|nr:amidohydrolase [Clostridia bacterium]
MDFYKRAKELKEETIKHRRFFHENAEDGLNMSKAVKYIFDELRALKLTPILCGNGVTAALGKGKPVLLLRADMDALPMREESGLEFASKTNCAHTCGHDLHAAMLLTAAKILCEMEDKLKGTVKLMFQPAEETLEGAKNMMDNGLFDEPSPDFALAFHVGAGNIPVGTVMYNNTAVMMNSADRFTVTVEGRGGHGAMAHLTVNPIKIGVNIYKVLEALAKENESLITIGKFSGGNTANVIPERVYIEGTIRTSSSSKREELKAETEKTVKRIAEKLGGSAKLRFNSGTPPLICNRDFTERVVEYIKELSRDIKTIPDISVTASDDFAFISERVPSAYIYLSAGFSDNKGEYTAHHPRVLFNEDVLPLGVAAFCKCAVEILK